MSEPEILPSPTWKPSCNFGTLTSANTLFSPLPFSHCSRTPAARHLEPNMPAPLGTRTNFRPNLGRCHTPRHAEAEQKIISFLQCPRDMPRPKKEDAMIHSVLMMVVHFSDRLVYSVTRRRDWTRILAATIGQRNAEGRQQFPPQRRRRRTEGEGLPPHLVPASASMDASAG